MESISNGVARTFGMPQDKLPTIVRKGFSTTLVNDVVLMDQLNEALLGSGILNDETLITEFPPLTGSEDMQMLVNEMEGVKIGYKFIGTADPELVAAARAKGLEVPFANHNPNYQVDLEAIPFGAKVAAVITLELLNNQSR